jgi:peroxiredoxin
LNRSLFLAIICFLSASCGKANSTSNPKKAKEKSEAKTEKENSIGVPDFTLEDVDENEHTLSDYKGKVVLINFFTIHCPSCRREMSKLMKLREKYKDEELVFLGVGFDKKKDNLKVFRDINKINFHILVGDEQTLKKYKLKGVPTTFIMNKKGEPTDPILGYNKRVGEILEEILLKFLENE